MKVLLLIFGFITCGSCQSCKSNVSPTEAPAESSPSSGGGGITTNIVGGGNANTAQCPYIVAFHNNTRADYLLYCAGSLITYQFILTAAHCVNFAPLSQIDFIAGTNNRNGTGEGAQKRKGAQAFVHPDFTPTLLLAPMQNDVAVVKTLNPFVESRYIFIIDMPTYSFYPDGNADVWGWGSTLYTNVTSKPDRLQTVVVPTLDRYTCSLDNAPYLFYNSQVCSGPGDKGACVGDSGGPMTLFSNDTGAKIRIVVAIVSYGYFPCGSSDRPSVYSLVSWYIDFIEGIVDNNQ